MAIIVSDSFTRANNPTSLGTAETGQAWSALEGTWGIVDNQAIVNILDSVAVVEAGVSNCEVTVTLQGTMEGRGPVIRQKQGATIDGLHFQIESSGGPTGTSLVLYERPSWIVVGRADIVQKYTTILRVVANGSDISIYLDGVLVLTVNHSYNLTETRHGMGGANTGQMFDDFLVTTIGHITQVQIGEYRMNGVRLPFYTLASVPAVNQLRTYHPIKGVGCFELVNTTDPKASSVRVRTSAGVTKAIKKL